MIFVDGVQRLSEQPDPKNTIAVVINGNTATVYEKGDTPPVINYNHQATPPINSKEGLKARLTPEQIEEGFWDHLCELCCPDCKTDLQ